LRVSSARHELLWLEIRHLRKQAIKTFGRTLGASEVASCLHRWKEREGEKSAQKLRRCHREQYLLEIHIRGERQSEVKSADEMWGDLEILEELDQGVKEGNQERALWYMQRLGPRVKAKERQLLMEDAQMQQDEFRVTPMKPKANQKEGRQTLQRIEEVYENSESGVKRL
jgi:hypothetical protein